MYCRAKWFETTQVLQGENLLKNFVATNQEQFRFHQHLRLPIQMLNCITS